MKKKLVVLVLAASMVLSACGAKAENAEANVETEMPTETETEAIADVEAPVEEEAPAEAEVEEEAETPTAEAADYIKGVSTETGWESEWLGIRYVCPEGMKMSTEEELNTAMGLGQEVLSEDFSEAQLKYAELASVYEMMSADELGITNVIVSVEKLPMALTAELYMGAVKQQLAAMTAMAYEVAEETETVNLGGVEFLKLACMADYEGVSMYQDYYATVIDDRAVAIVLTYIEETKATAEAVVNAFTAY